MAVMPTNTLPVKDTGVANTGTKASMNFVKDLVDKGVISSDMDYSVSEAEFNQGHVAMIPLWVPLKMPLSISLMIAKPLMTLWLMLKSK